MTETYGKKQDTQRLVSVSRLAAIFIPAMFVMGSFAAEIEAAPELWPLGTTWGDRC